MNLTLKFAGMILILFVGVVIGLQTAERGINKIDGTPDQKPQSFYITKVDKNEVEIALMGKQIKSTAPHKMVNYVSDTGSTIGTWVRKGTQGAIDWLSTWFQP
ncbi:DUF3679 domain-containing protein [Brevibacillus ginsengisoli]|uniref:DUF3679 domain-containing protein n=1 Tax=Brevibacillus ginsengisoli TaxID=363854 RepID=UPI003CFAB445